ncbi:MAG: hypothetical protein R3A48_01520 [Polyangiales bacterium]
MTREGIPEEHVETANALRERGFEIESVLGRGGVGVVFAAARDDAKLAVKVAAPWSSIDAGRDPEATLDRVRYPRLDDDGRTVRCAPPIEAQLCNRAVEGEVRRLREVEDDALVPVRESFTVNGRAAYVMPRVEGDTLKVAPGPGLRALVTALYRLHEKGFAHGDLKPENVRVTGESAVTLIDPMPVGSELVTPAWTHLNFLVSTPLVDSADPRDRRLVLRHRDFAALALMFARAWTGEQPWGHAEVARMLDRAVSMDDKRAELQRARERLQKLLPKLPLTLRPFVSLALDPGLWPEEGPIFAAYLQARPFETRCDAMSSMNLPELLPDIDPAPSDVAVTSGDA